MTKLKLGIAALASISLLPIVAMAQDTAGGGGFDVADAPAQAPAAASPASQPTAWSEVTVGVGDVTQSSDVYGRYNGLPKSGAGVLTGFAAEHRDAADAGGTRFFDVTADNVNFGNGLNAPEADVRLKLGQQGHWWVGGSYDAMTYYASSDFNSILKPDGSLTNKYQSALQAAGAFNPEVLSASGLTPTGGIGSHCPAAPIPVVWSSSNSFFTPTISCSASTGKYSYKIAGTAMATYGLANASEYEISTRRDKVAIDGGYRRGGWLFTAGLTHEHKEGTLEQSMTTAGSNTGMVAFPMPVNYDTDIYATAAAYNTELFQAAFSYEFSNFRDNNAGGFAFQGYNVASVAATTAPTGVGPTLPATTYNVYQMSGVYSLPPSNQAHSLTAQLGYNVSENTRLNGTFVYGLQLQNDPFVAATGNAFVLNSATLGPELASNPTSLNGRVQTFFGNATLTTRPMNRLDIKAAYTIDERKPQTDPMWIYGDPTDTTALKYREAVPESWTKQQFVLTAGYRLIHDTKLTLGYTYRDANRTNAITHEARDNEESIKLQSTLHETVTASLGYVHAERTASAPDFSLWNVQINSDCGSSLTNTLGCQQIPIYEAARTQDAVTGMFTDALNNKASLSLFAKYVNNAYHGLNAVYNATTNPSVGINRDYSIQIGPDFDYQISKTDKVHIFYTFLRTYRAMRALNNQGNGPGFYYSEATTYDVQTAGVSLAKQATPKLKLGADYVFSYGNVGFAQSGTWDNNEASQTYGGDPQLSTHSTDHQLKVHASYTYSPALSLYLGYKFDSLDTTDWALVGPTVGQVLSGALPPHYNVSSVVAAVKYRF